MQTMESGKLNQSSPFLMWDVLAPQEALWAGPFRVTLPLASEDFSHLSPVCPPSINVVKFQRVLTSLATFTVINYCLGGPHFHPRA